MNKLTKITRKKGYIYSVDRDGNVIESTYNIFKDKYTLVTLCIIILSALYYYQSTQSQANINNLDNTCTVYLQFKERWLYEHPGEIPAAKEILDEAIKNKWELKDG